MHTQVNRFKHLPRWFWEIENKEKFRGSSYWHNTAAQQARRAPCAQTLHNSGYKKLHLDKRHRQLTLIVREPITKRYFANWSMGFSSVTPEELTQIGGLNDFFHGGSCFVGLDSGRAKKLLAAFAKGRWRAKLTGVESPGV